MKLKDLKKNWDEFGKQDPLWSILADPTKKGNKWKIDDFFKTGEEEIESIIQYITSFGVSCSRKKALDFGCGVGRLTQALCQYFDECYGVDIAPSMIERAREYNRYDEKCKYYLNESNDLRVFEDNVFDFIYSKIVFQHMKPEYSKNYIKELLRVLTPGGFLVFQLPSEFAPIESLDRLVDSAYKAQITLQDSAITVANLSQTTIRVKVKNISDVTWPSFSESQGKSNICLGNHWLDKFGNIIINDDGREPLQKTLKPGEAVELLLTITVPKVPGKYILELDLVHENVTWFKYKGSETVRVPIKVEESAQAKSLISKILDFGSRFINIDVSKDNSSFFVPRMEMYGIPKDVVMELISSSGGKVLDVQQDFSVGQEWLSFLYCVTKD
jgi:SAM-dependent methyltransferase